MPQCHVWTCSIQHSITDHIATRKKLKNHSDQPKSQMEKVAQGFGPQNKVNKPGCSADHLEKETFQSEHVAMFILHFFITFGFLTLISVSFHFQ